MLSIIQKLHHLNLNKPFPYQDTNRIQEDFQLSFSELPEGAHFFTADFDEYCSNIAGTASHVLNGNTTKIPPQQIVLLHDSFFKRFPQYAFLENYLAPYHDFMHEHQTFEAARLILLEHLTTSTQNSDHS